MDESKSLSDLAQNLIDRLLKRASDAVADADKDLLEEFLKVCRNKLIDRIFETETAFSNSDNRKELGEKLISIEAEVQKKLDPKIIRIRVLFRDQWIVHNFRGASNTNLR